MEGQTNTDARFKIAFAIAVACICGSVVLLNGVLEPASRFSRILAGDSNYSVSAFYVTGPSRYVLCSDQQTARELYRLLSSPHAGGDSAADAGVFSLTLKFSDGWSTSRHMLASKDYLYVDDRLVKVDVCPDHHIRPSEGHSQALIRMNDYLLAQSAEVETILVIGEGGNVFEMPLWPHKQPTATARRDEAAKVD